MKKILAFVIAGVVFGTGFLFADSSEVGEYEQAKNLYNNKCQICHGMKGDGNGSAGSFLSPKPTDFTNPKFWQNNDEKKIAETIVNGKSAMPSFDLKPDEIRGHCHYRLYVSYL